MQASGWLCWLADWLALFIAVVVWGSGCFSKAESFLCCVLRPRGVFVLVFSYPDWVDVLCVVEPFSVVRRDLFSFGYSFRCLYVWLSVYPVFHFVRPPQRRIRVLLFSVVDLGSELLFNRLSVHSSSVQ